MQSLLKAIRGRQSAEEWRACGCLVLCALAFSLMTVCVKHLGGALPVAEIVFVRSLISIAITLAMLRRAQVSPWGQQRGLLLVRGLLGTTALLFFFEALARLPLAAATLLQYTYPTLTAISAWLLLGEPVRRRIGFAVLLGWLGVMLVVQPDWIGSSVAGLPAMAVVIGLGGALLTALAYVSVRQLSAREHPLVIVFYFPLVGMVLTLPLVLLEPVLPTARELLLLLGVGLFTQLGQIGITKGLLGMPAARATAMSYGQVPLAALWGWLVFREPLDPDTTLAAALVLAATLLSLRPRAADR